MSRLKGENKENKHRFTKIWFGITVPIAALAIISMWLVLNLTLTFLIVIEQNRTSEVISELKTSLETQDVIDENINKALSLDLFNIIAVLYDQEGNEVARSEFENYRNNIPTEIYNGMLEKIKDGLSKSDDYDKINHYSYSYLFGQEDIKIGMENYTLKYAAVALPWIENKNDLAIVGVFIMALIFTLTYAIARSFYKIYMKEVELENYYLSTSNALAHDLKTPLMAISGYAENLLENIHTEKREHYASAIVNNIENMNKMVENMLQVTNLNNKEIKLNKEELNLLEITEKILKQYQAMLDAKDISVTIQGNTMIYANASLMNRAIDNLIGNAVKYTPSKGNIFIRMENKEYEIENTGVSIDNKQINNMWKPFKKSDNARSKVGGTGIGLTIVKEILDAHKFKYKLWSENNSVVVKIFCTGY